MFACRCWLCVDDDDDGVDGVGSVCVVGCCGGVGV